MVVGCASGGGRTGERDAGTNASADGGPMRLDGGPMRLDGGPIGIDAAPQDGGTIAMRDAGREVDAGPMGSDAGRDAGPSDGGRDAGPPAVDTGPPPCASAADCDDGTYCNGLERCELGACVAGAPPVCDDGIACTRDRCVEPSSGTTPSCEYVRDDALCPAGQSCGATGCMSTCSESPCRLVAPQCGCGAGQGCYLSGATRSCSAAGSALEGGSCASATSCAPGLACLDISTSTTPVNQCMRFCASDAECVGAGSLCVYSLGDGMGGTVPGANVCSRSCDPVTSSGCTTSASCQIFRESGGAMRFFTDCTAPVGIGGQYDPCLDASDCQRGYACVPSSFGSGNECLQFCRVGGSDCFFGETCYGFTTPLIIGSTQYGVCDF